MYKSDQNQSSVRSQPKAQSDKENFWVIPVLRFAHMAGKQMGTLGNTPGLRYPLGLRKGQVLEKLTAPAVKLKGRRF